MAMERKFCGLFGDVLKNCEKLSYEVQFAYFWQAVEFANNQITKYRQILDVYAPYLNYLGL